MEKIITLQALNSSGSDPFTSLKNPEKLCPGFSWFCIPLILLLGCSPAFSQATFNWNQSQSTSLNNESAHSIAVDSINQFIYTTGYIEHSGAFSGLSSSDMNNGSGNGAKDGFLAKHDFSGNLIWAVNMGSSNQDETHAVCLAADGNLYVTGYCEGQMRFKSLGSPNFTLSASLGNQDAFVASYTSNGKFRWAKRGGGTQYDAGLTITGNRNSVVVMGHYENTGTFGPYTTSALHNTSVNFFIINYSFNGTENWLSEAKSPADDGTGSPFIYLHPKIIYSNDTLFCIASFGGTNLNFVNSNASVFTTSLSGTGGNDDIFYAALSSSGNWIWAQQINSTTSFPQLGFGIAADCYGIYISGSVHPNGIFPSGYSLSPPFHDVPFIAKCSRSTGIDNWVKSWDSNVNHEDIASHIKTDGKGYLYVMGSFLSTGFFAPDGNLGSVNGTEIFMAKYSTAGTFQWVQAIKGNGNNHINDFSIDGNKISLCGQFENDITFPPLPLLSGSSLNTNIYISQADLSSSPVLYSCCSSPPSAATVGPDLSVCSGSVTINAAPPSTGAGTWYVVEGANSTGSGVISSSLAPSTTVNGLVSGNNIFTWVVSNNFCNPSIDSISVKKDDPPSIATAGSSQTLCANNPSLTLSANTPTVGTGSWSVISGAASVTTPTLSTSQATALGTGTNILQWTITNGSCPPSTSIVQITVDALPDIANAGVSQTLCANNPSLVLSGNTPTVGTGSWSILTGTANIVSSASPTSSALTLGTGTNVLQWSISNGSCPVSTSTVLIQVDQVPSIASAGSNQTLCASNPSLTLNGNVPLIGSGLWSVLSGTASISSPTLASSAATSIAAGSHILQWSISNGICPLSTSVVQIQVDQVPTIASAGSNQTLCASNPSLTLNGNTPSVGTGLWTLVSGTASIISPTTAGSNANALGTGTNILQWTISNGSCPPSASSVQILVDQLPTTALAGSNQSICATSGTLNLNGSLPTVGSGLWSVISGTANLLSPTSPTGQANSFGAGTNVLQWSITNGSCPPSASTVQINIDQPPSISSAGSNQTLCAGSPSLILNANTPSIGTGSWSVVSGAANFSSPSSPTSAATSIATGTNILQWVVSNGVCPNSTSTLQVQVDQLSTIALAGSNQTLCVNNPSLTLSANTPTSGAGTWSVVSGTANILAVNSPTSNAISLGSGINILQWSITNGSCPPSASTIQIDVDLMPTTALAGMSQTLCINNPTTTLGANIPGVGTGMWSLLSGTASITTPTSEISPVASLTTGTNVLQWSISNGICPASTSTMQIQVDDVPAMSLAGINQTLCAGNPTLTLSGNTPSVGTGSWSVISGAATIASLTSPTSSVTSIGTGTNILQWTIMNGSCPASTSSVQIEVDQIPSTSLAGSNQTLCANNPSLTLSGNTPAVGTGLWTVISGTAGITTPTLETSQVTGIGTGTAILQWSISNGSCPPSTSTLQIQVDDMPTVSIAGTSQTLCANNPTLVLSANMPNVGMGLWTVTDGGAFITAPNSPGSIANTFSTGINTLQWSIMNGSCPPSTSTVQIQVDAVPSLALAGSSQTLCAISYTLNAVNPVIGSGTWNVITGTSAVANPKQFNSSVTNLSIGSNILEWSVKNGVCPINSSTLELSVSAFPDVSLAGNDLTICETDSIQLNANAPVNGTGSWLLIQGGGIISNYLANTTYIKSLAYGENIFRWTIASSPCPSTTDDLKITVYQKPSTANAGPDQTVYSEGSSLNSNFPSVGSGQWQSLNFNNQFSNAFYNTSAVSSLDLGTNILIWQISNGVCPLSSDTIIITREPVIIPNAFSPNNDNVNDVFHIQGIEIMGTVKLNVFNRWGDLVYYNDSYKNSWDGTNTQGTPLSDDTYYFVLQTAVKSEIKGYVIIKRN